MDLLRDISAFMLKEKDTEIWDFGYLCFLTLIFVLFWYLNKDLKIYYDYYTVKIYSKIFS